MTPTFICTPVIRKALLTIAKRYKHSKCLSICEQIFEKCGIYAVKYYSALKWNKFLIRAITWMNLEDKLSEIHQPQKDKYCMITLI